MSGIRARTHLPDLVMNTRSITSGTNTTTPRQRSIARQEEWLSKGQSRQESVPGESRAVIVQLRGFLLNKASFSNIPYASPKHAGRPESISQLPCGSSPPHSCHKWKRNSIATDARHCHGFILLIIDPTGGAGSRPCSLPQSSLHRPWTHGLPRLYHKWRHYLIKWLARKNLDHLVDLVAWEALRNGGRSWHHNGALSVDAKSIDSLLQ